MEKLEQGNINEYNMIVSPGYKQIIPILHLKNIIAINAYKCKTDRQSMVQKIIFPIKSKPGTITNLHLLNQHTNNP